MTTIAPERATLGYGLAADEGEAIWLLGMLQTIKIGRDDTAGQYGLVEVVVPEGVGSPWHVHAEEDEWFYVLEGELTVWVADTRLSLKAGGFAFGPKGVPHTFYAEAGGARCWSASRRCSSRDSNAKSVSPPPSASCRRRWRATPDMARLAAIALRNGFEILGPPGPPPGH